MDLTTKISDEEFKNQLQNDDDIMSQPLVAPNTKVKLKLYGTTEIDIFSGLPNGEDLTTKPCCAKLCSKIRPFVKMNFICELEECEDRKSFLKKYIKVHNPVRRRARNASRNRTVTHQFFIYDEEVCLTYFCSLLELPIKYLRCILKEVDSKY